MVSLPELIHSLVSKCFVTGFSLGHHNVTLGTTAILKLVVWCKLCLDILNRLSVVHEYIERTDGRTDRRNCDSSSGV